MEDVVVGQDGFHVLNHDLYRGLIDQMEDHSVGRNVGRTFGDVSKESDDPFVVCLFFNNVVKQSIMAMYEWCYS
jgi:hypothetical protein